MVLNRAVSAIQHLFGNLLSDDKDLSWTKDAPENLGKKLIGLLEEGEYPQLRSLLARRIRWLVSSKKLEQSWKSVLATQGKVVSVTVGDVSKDGDMTVVRFPLVFEKSSVSVVVRISPNGHLMGIRAIPDYSAAPWSPPSYADINSFTEEELILGAEDREVPASLTIPNSPPQAAVIMLQGSGPSDRNSSLGQLKPFKDLAWGLSSRGLATIRFDKFTYVHPGKPMENVTIKDEYIHHAEAAMAVLQMHPKTKDTPIFVLGHSLGGTVAPRFAQGEPSIAGLVIMGGSAKPLHWTAVRQLQHLNTLKDKKHHVAKSVIESAIKQAKFIDSSHLTPSTPSSKLPFDIPAAYWLDLRQHEPVAIAATLRKPMLILQGGRDYQVTVRDDFQAWRVGLKDQKDVTFKVYADKNHLFRSGKGLSSPEEYEVAGGHVDENVVGDVVTWLTKHGKKVVVKEVEVPKAAEPAKDVEVPKEAGVPKAAEDPKTAGDPKTAKGPKTAEDPKTAEVPKEVKPTQEAEDRNTAEAAKKVEFSKTAEDPKTVEVPKEVKPTQEAEDRNTAEAAKKVEFSKTAEDPSTAKPVQEAELPNPVEPEPAQEAEVPKESS